MRRGLFQHPENGTMPVRILRQFDDLDIVKNCLNRHENHRGMWGPVFCTTPVSILNSEATECNAWRKTTGWPNRPDYLVEDVAAAHHRPHVTVVRDWLRSSGSGLLHQVVRQPLSVESRLPPLATLIWSESFMLPTNSLSPSLAMWRARATTAFIRPCAV